MLVWLHAPIGRMPHSRWGGMNKISTRWPWHLQRLHSLTCYLSPLLRRLCRFSCQLPFCAWRPRRLSILVRAQNSFALGGGRRQQRATFLQSIQLLLQSWSVSSWFFTGRSERNFIIYIYVRLRVIDIVGVSICRVCRGHSCVSKSAKRVEDLARKGHYK